MYFHSKLLKNINIKYLPILKKIIYVKRRANLLFVHICVINNNPIPNINF